MAETSTTILPQMIGDVPACSPQAQVCQGHLTNSSYFLPDPIHQVKHEESEVCPDGAPVPSGKFQV